MEKNSSIKCSVEQCKYHACSEDYCTLDSIKVGTHESNPKQVECTDCLSFELKQYNDLIKEQLSKNPLY